jgi:RNA polymerase sigma-70 factor (ECF subfamily)
MADDSRRSRFEAQALPLAGFLHRLGTRLSGDPGEAADLVQEAFLKAWRAFDSFREGTNFRAWIARILTNTFLNQQAKRRRWTHAEDPDAFPERPQSVAPGAAVVRRLADIPPAHFGDEVRRALGELPNDMAIAVYLADVEELRYEEIADILECPVGTVRSRISRARRHLQERLLDVARDRGFVGRSPS